MGTLEYELEGLEKDWQKSTYQLYSIFLSDEAPLLDNLSMFGDLIRTVHTMSAKICRIYFFMPDSWNIPTAQRYEKGLPSFEPGKFVMFKKEHLYDLARGTEQGTQKLFKELNQRNATNLPAQLVTSPSLLFFYPPSKGAEIFKNLYLAPLGQNPLAAAKNLFRPFSSHKQRPEEFNAEKYIQWVEGRTYLEEAAPPVPVIQLADLAGLLASIVSIPRRSGPIIDV